MRLSGRPERGRGADCEGKVDNGCGDGFLPSRRTPSGRNDDNEMNLILSVSMDMSGIRRGRHMVRKRTITSYA